MLYSVSPLSVFRLVGLSYRLSLRVFTKTWYLNLFISILVFMVTMFSVVIGLYQINRSFNFYDLKNAALLLLAEQNAPKSKLISTKQPEVSKLKIERATETDRPAIYEQNDNRMRIERVGAKSIPQTSPTVLPPTPKQTESFTQKLQQEISTHLQNVKADVEKIELLPLTAVITEIITYLLFIYLWVITLYRAHNIELNIEDTAGQALRVGLKRLFKSTVVTVLAFVIMVAVMAIFTFILVYLLALTKIITPQSDTVITVITIIDVLFTVWLSLYLFLFPIALAVTDNLSIFKCFTMGWRLVWGNWWRALFITIWSTLILFVLLFLFFFLLSPALIKIIFTLFSWILPKIGIPTELTLLFLIPTGYILLYSYIMSLSAGLNLIMLNDFRLRQHKKTTVEPV